MTYINKVILVFPGMLKLILYLCIMKEQNINLLETTFKCTLCAIEKPNSDFYKHNTARRHRKFSYWCKSCTLKRGTELGYSKKANSFRRVENPFLSLYYYTMSRATKTKRLFNIKVEDLHNIYKKQEGLCYYSGQTLEIKLGSEDSISVDRINSHLDYTLDNICLCRWKINRMKNNLSKEDLIKCCKDIINNLENEKK